jgi:SAM-dependent methyltransferase
MTPAFNISYEPVRDIFEAMCSEQINGVPLSDVVGGGDPEKVAAEVVAMISNHATLNAVGSILDLGCGCGRIATALTQHLRGQARYVGVDIVPALIEFGRKFITPRYPHFKFLLLDQGNLTYDSWRPKQSQTDIAKLSEAHPHGSVDLAISVSLFTHLDYASAVEILAALADLLVHDGRAFITIFVLDAEAKEGIEHGRTGFTFKHRTPSGRLYAEKVDDPTYAVAYDRGEIDKLIHSAGCALERWVRGYWSQGGPGEIFQDVLILRKTECNAEPRRACL